MIQGFPERLGRLIGARPVSNKYPSLAAMGMRGHEESSRAEVGEGVVTVMARKVVTQSLGRMLFNLDMPIL